MFGVMQVFRALESGELHDRGDRRDHRPGDRPAEERDVPHDRHRRHRRARRTWPADARASSCRRSSTADGRARHDRREGGPRVLQEGRRRDPHARSGDARVPAEAAGEAAVARGGAIDRAARRAHPQRSSRARTRSATFLRATLGPTLDYAAQIAAEIAHSTDDIDRAMRWGFGWELGPFETLARRSSSQVRLPHSAQRSDRPSPQTSARLRAHAPSRVRRKNAGREPGRSRRRRALPSSSTRR